jgi:hypothetical protein
MKKQKEWVAAGEFPPTFPLKNFPESEREGIKHIQSLLFNLSIRIINFDAAIWLARWSNDEREALKSKNRYGGFVKRPRSSSINLWPRVMAR